MLLCRDPLVWLCCESEAKELAVSGAVDCVLSVRIFLVSKQPAVWEKCKHMHICFPSML